MRELIKASKALSDETRLRILHLLTERECCVCEVMQALEISQARASRNLGALHDAGFLKLRKEGLWSFYSIDKEKMKHEFSDLAEFIGNALKDNATAVLDSKRLREANSTMRQCAI